LGEKVARISGIEPRQEGSRSHLVAFIGPQFGDSARDARRDIHLNLGIKQGWTRHSAGERPSKNLNGLNLHRKSIAPTE
jgi:hypothetical protein